MLPPESANDIGASEAAKPWRDATRLLSMLSDAGFGIWSWDLQRGVMHGSAGTGRLLGLDESLAEISLEHYLALVVEDEAAFCGDDLYIALRPMLAVSGGRLILMSTPNGRRFSRYRACAPAIMKRCLSW